MRWCDQCEPVRINGTVCHETGCPDAWRDESIECRECGFNFIRDERYQTVCTDCVEAQYEGHYADGMIGEYDEDFAAYQYDYPESDLWYEC